ncbi:hypothetical protein DFH09DRAFT_1089354 [Mycena vulgaris]|nr:hypothetical protein DFH09DRAFT_1089354 [Mycena vulgaris]
MNEMDPNHVQDRVLVDEFTFNLVMDTIVAKRRLTGTFNLAAKAASQGWPQSITEKASWWVSHGKYCFEAAAVLGMRNHFHGFAEISGYASNLAVSSLSRAPIPSLLFKLLVGEPHRQAPFDINETFFVWIFHLSTGLHGVTGVHNWVAEEMGDLLVKVYAKADEVVRSRTPEPFLEMKDNWGVPPDSQIYFADVSEPEEPRVIRPLPSLPRAATTAIMKDEKMDEFGPGPIDEDDTDANTREGVQPSRRKMWMVGACPNNVDLMRVFHEGRVRDKVGRDLEALGEHDHGVDKAVRWLGVFSEICSRAHLDGQSQPEIRGIALTEWVYGRLESSLYMRASSSIDKLAFMVYGLNWPVLCETIKILPEVECAGGVAAVSGSQDQQHTTSETEFVQEDARDSSSDAMHWRRNVTDSAALLNLHASCVENHEQDQNDNNNRPCLGCAICWVVMEGGTKIELHATKRRRSVHPFAEIKGLGPWKDLEKPQMSWEW